MIAVIQAGSHTNSTDLERGVYPETLGEDGGGDLLVLGHLREQLVVGGLVEEHRVVDLLLLLSLAPLLQKSTNAYDAMRTSPRRDPSLTINKIRETSDHLLLLLAAAGLGRLRGRRRGLVLLRGLQRGTRAD